MKTASKMHLLQQSGICRLNSPVDEVVEHIIGNSHGKHICSSIVWNWVHMRSISAEEVRYIPLGKKLIRSSQRRIVFLNCSNCRRYGTRAENPRVDAY